MTALASSIPGALASPQRKATHHGADGWAHAVVGRIRRRVGVGAVMRAAGAVLDRCGSLASSDDNDLERRAEALRGAVRCRREDAATARESFALVTECIRRETGLTLHTAQIAAAFGAKVVAIDVDDDKLANIAKHGAALTLNARNHDGKGLRDAIRAFAKENGLRQTEWYIFECSGTAVGQTTAYGLLNRGATMAVVGFTMDKVEVRLSNLMAFHARLLGNWGCVPENYPGALDLVLDGKIQVAPFVEKRSLDDINQVFHDVHAGQVKRRVVLVPGK